VIRAADVRPMLSERVAFVALIWPVLSITAPPVGWCDGVQGIGTITAESGRSRVGE
jgi:hypothetical protein